MSQRNPQPFPRSFTGRNLQSDQVWSSEGLINFLLSAVSAYVFHPSQETMEEKRWWGWIYSSIYTIWRYVFLKTKRTWDHARGRSQSDRWLKVKAKGKVEMENENPATSINHGLPRWSSFLCIIFLTKSLNVSDYMLYQTIPCTPVCIFRIFQAYCVRFTAL